MRCVAHGTRHTGPLVNSLRNERDKLHAVALSGGFRLPCVVYLARSVREGFVTTGARLNEASRAPCDTRQSSSEEGLPRPVPPAGTWGSTLLTRMTAAAAPSRPPLVCPGGRVAGLSCTHTAVRLWTHAGEERSGGSLCYSQPPAH